MRAFARNLTLIFATFFFLSTAYAQQTSPLTSPAIEARVNALLGQMTLDEKIGQLTQFSGGTPTGPGTGRSDYMELIAQGKVGSMFNVQGPKKTNEFQRVAMTKSRLKIPLLFGLDVIHGYRTEFPVPLGLAATWNPELVRQAARVAAQESATDGIRWTFSPMVDIARDARWGRIVEGAGEDPYLGMAMAEAYVRGYQGNIGAPDSVAACAKHYVGYGAAEGGRDYNTAEIPDRLLRDVYLPPFHAAERAGALSFMSAFNPLNGVPASANPYTLRQILRKEWGFKGIVVSDWTSIFELIAHGIANDGPTAARKALLAGVDMDMESDLYHKHLADLVKSGEVPMSVIDESVRNILRVKFAMGLFEHPYADETRNVYAGPLPPASRQLARTAAEESFVLLKNDAVNGKPVLPLDSQSTRSIALLGPLGDDAANMLGSWGGGGKPEDVVTLKQALTDRGVNLNFAKGTDIETTSNAGFAAALDAARQSDVVLLAMGEDAGNMTGEAASRTRINLPGNQEEFIQQVAALGKPTILIIFSGRPLVLKDILPKVNAVMEAWFPGVEAGPALARTLFGEANPSGRLTVSFPRAVGQEPLYYNALSTGRPATGVDLSHSPTTGEDKYHSRYIDEGNSAQFPFGYGLSYSAFTYTQPRLSGTSFSSTALNSGSATIRVTADVKNTSTRSGQEVVQLYISQRGTSVARPVRELKGFQKVMLNPGESKTVQFTLSRAELSFWNIDMKNVVEPAKVQVWVAHDSESGTPVEFTITR